MIFYISLERSLILTSEMFFYGGKQKDSLLVRRSLSFYFVVEIKIIKKSIARDSPGMLYNEVIFLVTNYTPKELNIHSSW